ncbi:hypothetical protein GP486_005690 [Trichoglossum hirsutum]|uniref:J domain-containing protein n=1 Tax=Trichoglossum hirsutum TaxID=265104 RepID=A0A9P8RLS1_9PEZI|nr:hypothetical protein GP486_005690 [Trichoglossum hirsutum]
MASPEFEDTARVDGYSSSRRSKFRFKSKSRSISTDDKNTSYPRKRYKSLRHRDEQQRHDHHYHRPKRQRRSREGQTIDDPTLYDDTHLPNSRSSQYLSPDAAFRESLFDAMADDEGAAYWEGVFGQPLHVYPKEKPGPDGELEQMTDEEYTAYVRAKMYEKTHQHIIEEKARREEAKRQERETTEKSRRMQQEHAAFQKDIEESLRRGEERTRKKRVKERWRNYTKAWQDFGSTRLGVNVDSTRQVENVRRRIPWPVETGQFSDVSREGVEKFFLSAPSACESQGEKLDLQAILKIERVRWHPDKMQQRLGGEGLDRDTMAAVTAVFQVVDRLWSEMRDKKPQTT